MAGFFMEIKCEPSVNSTIALIKITVFCSLHLNQYSDKKRGNLGKSSWVKNFIDSTFNITRFFQYFEIIRLKRAGAGVDFDSYTINPLVSIRIFLHNQRVTAPRAALKRQRRGLSIEKFESLKL